MSFKVETCNSVWEQRSIHPTYAEAMAHMQKLIDTEHWGTLSIRVQQLPKLKVAKSSG